MGRGWNVFLGNLAAKGEGGVQPGGLKCFEKRESRGKRKGKGSYKNPDCENRLTSRSEEKELLKERPEQFLQKSTCKITILYHYKDLLRNKYIYKWCKFNNFKI